MEGFDLLGAVPPRNKREVAAARVSRRAQSAGQRAVAAAARIAKRAPRLAAAVSRAGQKALNPKTVMKKVFRARTAATVAKPSSAVSRTQTPAARTQTPVARTQAATRMRAARVGGVDAEYTEEVDDSATDAQSDIYSQLADAAASVADFIAEVQGVMDRLPQDLPLVAKLQQSISGFEIFFGSPIENVLSGATASSADAGNIIDLLQNVLNQRNESPPIGVWETLARANAYLRAHPGAGGGGRMSDMASYRGPSGGTAPTPDATPAPTGAPTTPPPSGGPSGGGSGGGPSGGGPSGGGGGGGSGGGSGGGGGGDEGAPGSDDGGGGGAYAEEEASVAPPAEYAADDSHGEEATSEEEEPPMDEDNSEVGRGGGHGGGGHGHHGGHGRGRGHGWGWGGGYYGPWYDGGYELVENDDLTAEQLAELVARKLQQKKAHVGSGFDVLGAEDELGYAAPETHWYSIATPGTIKDEMDKVLREGNTLDRDIMSFSSKNPVLPSFKTAWSSFWDGYKAFYNDSGWFSRLSGGKGDQVVAYGNQLNDWRARFQKFDGAVTTEPSLTAIERRADPTKFNYMPLVYGAVAVVGLIGGGYALSKVAAVGSLFKKSAA